MDIKIFLRKLCIAIGLVGTLSLLTCYVLVSQHYDLLRIQQYLPPSLTTRVTPSNASKVLGQQGNQTNISPKGIQQQTDLSPKILQPQTDLSPKSLQQQTNLSSKSLQQQTNLSPKSLQQQTKVLPQNVRKPANVPGKSNGQPNIPANVVDLSTTYDNVNKPTCEERLRRKLKPMTKKLPITALASPWRSGNTWIRHLLQMATGIGTTSQYCDKQLQSSGFPFECQKQDFAKFIVKKTHEPFETNPRSRNTIMGQQFQRAVVIIRDLYTFTVANVYSGHAESVNESTFFSPKFQTIGQPKIIRRWNYFNNYWLKEFKGLVYPVLYTNFIRDTEGELRKILKFLGISFDDADIKCALDNKEGNFHRKSRVWTRISNLKELFSAERQKQIDNSIKEVSELLLTKYGVKWVNDTYTVKR